MDDYGFVFEEIGSPLENRLAQTISQVLQDAYPDHGWLVTVRDNYALVANTSVNTDPWNQLKGSGVMFIRLEDIANAARLKKKTLMFGGEYLERAGLARGAYHGDQAKRIER